jgi:hypothetical protein
MIFWPTLSFVVNVERGDVKEYQASTGLLPPKSGRNVARREFLKECMLEDLEFILAILFNLLGFLIFWVSVLFTCFVVIPVFILVSPLIILFPLTEGMKKRKDVDL